MFCKILFYLFWLFWLFSLDLTMLFLSERKLITVSLGSLCCLLTFPSGCLSHVRFPILSFLYSLHWRVVFCFLFSIAVIVGHSFYVSSFCMLEDVSPFFIFSMVVRSLLIFSFGTSADVSPSFFSLVCVCWAGRRDKWKFSFICISLFIGKKLITQYNSEKNDGTSLYGFDRATGAE